MTKQTANRTDTITAGLREHGLHQAANETESAAAHLRAGEMEAAAAEFDSAADRLSADNAAVPHLRAYARLARTELR